MANACVQMEWQAGAFRDLMLCKGITDSEMKAFFAVRITVSVNNHRLTDSAGLYRGRTAARGQAWAVKPWG